MTLSHLQGHSPAAIFSSATLRTAVQQLTSFSTDIARRDPSALTELLEPNRQ